MPSQQPVTFEGPLGTLRGMLHLPDGDGAVPAVVMLHGFTGHHIEDQRLFVQMARELAAKFAVLRFDFYGSGDSDGTFDAFTVQTELADAVAALDWISAQPRIDAARTGIIGLSMGGCVAALLSGTDPRVKAVVLWSAAGLPHSHAPLFEAIEADNYQLEGLRLSPAFWPVYRDSDPAGHLAHYAGPGLVIWATADEVIAEAEADALHAALGPRGTLIHIAGADHTFKNVEARRELFEITARWLVEHL